MPEEMKKKTPPQLRDGVTFGSYSSIVAYGSFSTHGSIVGHSSFEDAGSILRVATRLVQKYVVRNRPRLSGGAGRCPSSKLGSQGGFRVAEIFAERKGPALGLNGAGLGKYHLS
jgi:hypothetical protein